MIKPKCLLSGDIDSHNWSENNRPNMEIFKKPHVVTGCHCIDCFVVYYVVWGEPNRSPWSPWNHGKWIFEGEYDLVVETILRVKSRREKIGILWPKDHLFNKLENKKSE